MSRILLMYIHERSGHHHAALALEKAFKAADPGTRCLVVDELRYTHPILERLIRTTYLEIVRKNPEVWEYLYDNAWVLKNTRALRHSIHKSHSKKFKALLDEFRPDAIVCTQAFPCGIVSDYKATYAYPVPLYGVLTDYLPHSYWVMDRVDRYFVPTEEAKKKLEENGIFEDRIAVTGIPIDPSFAEKDGAGRPSKKRPHILIMGGSQGLGPLERIVAVLDGVEERFDMTVVTGQNARLYRRFTRRAARFRKKVRVLSYVDNVAELMRGATLLVSKPGGLSIAQALAAKLPVIFMDPIPGQEAKNASILLEHRAAVEAKSEEEAARFVSELLKSPEKIRSMKRSMAHLARPDAALRIAKSVLAGGAAN
ncbi:MAG: MGDG synthase family glycosyltransferase [Candidatus Omnitrophota bacterium]